MSTREPRTRRECLRATYESVGVTAARFVFKAELCGVYLPSRRSLSRYDSTCERRMTWAKLDDLYDDNRKIKRAWRSHPRAVGLHAMSISYSARHETDGLIDLEWLEDKMPKPAEREAVIRALVDCGLYEPVDGEFFRVHDYTDFNPSHEDLQEKRRRDAERKRNPKRGAADSTRSPNGVASHVRLDSAGSPGDSSRVRPQASPAGIARGPSRPDPSRPGVVMD